MTLRAVLVDDERLARVVLRELLKAHPDIVEVAEAHSVRSAVVAIEQHDPDLVFLDVQMPGAEGTQLFDEISLRAHVIFVTAYDHYAVRAFELNALDYLLKPVEPERLRKALDRARDTRVLPTPQESRPDGTLARDELLCLPHRGGLRFVRVNTLTHLSAEGDYCLLHPIDGAAILSSFPLRSWQERLPTSFVRVHRSHIVNTDQVDRVIPDASSFEVLMIGGARVPMSRRRGAELRNTLSGTP